VADISAAYAEWSARGAEFVTEPKDHGREIRACIHDSDGHLIHDHAAFSASGRHSFHDHVLLAAEYDVCFTRS
jgi:hypothetical protein